MTNKQSDEINRLVESVRDKRKESLKCAQAYEDAQISAEDARQKSWDAGAAVELAQKELFSYIRDSASQSE